MLSSLSKCHATTSVGTVGAKEGRLMTSSALDRITSLPGFAPTRRSSNSAPVIAA